MSFLFCNGLSYPMMQINGQRTTGPATNWCGVKPPPENLEIYISNIPKNKFEEDLMPIFASFGEIYQFRLMMSFSGENRGYGYLIYTKDEDTKMAMNFLKTVKIAENQLHVRPSKNNCVLILGYINVTLDFATIVKMINNLAVAKKINVINTDIHKIAYIEYNSHREAALSRRALLVELRSFGTGAWVRWHKFNQF